MTMYLSDDFIQQYEKKIPPFGPLGMFVALRTYQRWLDDKARRERWHETCRRVVEYSMSLYQGPADYAKLKEEAEELFDALFNLRVFAAGRTNWSGGTESSLKNPLSNFNCAHTVIDSFTAFKDAFYLLMLGCGVGYRVLFEDVTKLPPVNTDIVFAHKPYHPKQKHERIEDTQVYEGDGSVYIIVGDSRQGWCSALEQYLTAIQRKDIDAIIINYDSVRPAGEPLKTFGGRASGHQSIKQMFAGIHTVIKSSSGILRPIDCMDIMGLIAENVCVGGTRRSSLICLFDENDAALLNAKVDLYKEGSVNFGKNWRSNSNNTIFFENKPTKERLLDIFKRIVNNGEPGFLGAQAARKRRPWFKGINPCAN